MQRLRRACQRRKNGKVPGGEEALTMYQDTDKRLELARLLIDSKFDKDTSHIRTCSIQFGVFNLCSYLCPCPCRSNSPFG